MKYHRNVDHTPLKQSSDRSSLDDQLDENRKRIFENNKDTSLYALNFHSHTF